ncbi:hypothetical protein JCGZ_21689 [Jatropha curcas]|uniref:CBS domain-containing protein n=1 Tax=Jatropha curcas TaxID=180498 RepID=A0A067JEQ5_JATCU|nr:hypothetical protein JCGZ_21689 [Jatropha curcas]
MWGSSKLANCDAYFEMIQSRKKLPQPLQETLTSAFARIPVSSFPLVPGGKVIEIPAETSVADAVKILSKCNIMSAPSAELAAVALSASTTTVAGVVAGALGTTGAVALGITGPDAIAGLTAAAVGAAVAGGVGADKGLGKDAPAAANNLGEDFYNVILQEEHFKSTTVRSVLKSYHSAPFLPVATDSSMLSVLLLLSKYRQRNVPVIEPGKPEIQNFITQSAFVLGLEGCKGRDWFDCIASRSISDFGLPFMSADEVVSIQSSELILEAFKQMRENQIGGLPVVEGPKKKIVGSLSIRDIRHLLLEPELFTNFRQLTVSDFTQIISSTQETGRVIPPITCKVDVTLGSVIHILASKSVHRIYAVAGNENEIAGVITLRDVIACFVYEPPNHSDNYLGFSVKDVLND